MVDPADPAADTQRFGDWLAARGQSERARRALWDLFSVSALNIAGDDASLALAATVVKTGLLGKNNAADIGVPALPLGELHGDAAATVLAKLGAQVTLGAKVTAIEGGAIEGGAMEDGASSNRGADARFRVRLGRGEGADLAADAVVLAVPHEKAAPLVPPGALPDATVRGWAGLGASPIVNVHVIYDRPVTDLPFAAAIDSPVQWVFDRTRISGMDVQVRAVPGHLAVGGRRVRGRARGPAARAVRARAGRTVPRGPRRPGHRVLRHPRAAGDLPPGAGQRRAAAEGRDPAARTGAGRRMDRHWMAGHDGRRGAQRPGRGRRAP